MPFCSHTDTRQGLACQETDQAHHHDCKKEHGRRCKKVIGFINQKSLSLSLFPRVRIQT